LIRLRFTGVTHPHGVFVGPAPWFRLVGAAVLQGPDGDVVGQFREGQWMVRNAVFNRFDCRQPMVLHLENGETGAAEEIGRLEECAVVGAVVFGDGAPVATWDPGRNLWLSSDTELAWPALVIRTGPPHTGFPRFRPGAP
jgi:hypothetical protein